MIGRQIHITEGEQRRSLLISVNEDHIGMANTVEQFERHGLGVQFSQTNIEGETGEGCITGVVGDGRVKAVSMISRSGSVAGRLFWSRRRGLGLAAEAKCAEGGGRRCNGLFSRFLILLILGLSGYGCRRSKYVR